MHARSGELDHPTGARPRADAVELVEAVREDFALVGRRAITRDGTDRRRDDERALSHGSQTADETGIVGREEPADDFSLPPGSRTNRL